MKFEVVFKAVFDINIIVFDPHSNDTVNIASLEGTLGPKGTPSNLVLNEEDSLLVEEA